MSSSSDRACAVDIRVFHSPYNIRLKNFNQNLDRHILKLEVFIILNSCSKFYQHLRMFMYTYPNVLCIYTPYELFKILQDGTKLARLLRYIFTVKYQLFKPVLTKE